VHIKHTDLNGKNYYSHSQSRAVWNVFLFIMEHKLQ